MFKKIVIFIILVVLLAIAGEWLLDITHYSTEILLQYQPDFGWSHLSGKDFWYKGHLFSINKDGFRDVNHKKEKPEGVTRIAFISSHYLRGTNSDFDKIATTILEKSWNEKNKKKIEVFNFAVSQYNLKMAYFLIKKFGQEYDIDYFIYLFDPQRDPAIATHDLEESNYSPTLIFDENGDIQEKLDFIKPPFDAEEYKAFKIYQFAGDVYKKMKSIIKSGDESDSLSQGESDQDIFEPYPEVYLDRVSASTTEAIEKMAKLMDYTIENNQTKFYILLLPPQQTQAFNYYEREGNLNQLNTPAFLKSIKEFHGWGFKDFISDVMFFIEKGKENHFDPNNLTMRLKEKIKYPERLIDLNNEFLKLVEDPSSNGFLYNWHRRDAGQAYLAGLLERLVIPELLDDNNLINNR